MIARTCAFASGVVAVAVALFCSSARAEDLPPPDVQKLRMGAFTLVGPYTHENLTIYLVRGTDRLDGKHYVTLADALRRRIAVVRDNRNVNELQICNFSYSEEIYIQSGEIVKGGQQDRTIAVDTIIPPRSGPVPLKAFCVEHGRWAGRAGESSDRFDDSVNFVAGREMKLAVQKQADQDAVWDNVQKNQAKLAASAGGDVTDPRSATSFQLTLENKQVREATQAYSAALARMIASVPPEPGHYVRDFKGRAVSFQPPESPVVGYVTVINGKVTGADVYASSELLARLWPKLLTSAAVEAFAERQKQTSFEPVRIEAVKAVMEQVDGAVPVETPPTGSLAMRMRESADAVVFETFDCSDARAVDATMWIHRSYLTNDAYIQSPAAPAAPPEPEHVIVHTTRGGLPVEPPKP